MAEIEKLLEDNNGFMRNLLHDKYYFSIYEGA